MGRGWGGLIASAVVGGLAGGAAHKTGSGLARLLGAPARRWREVRTRGSHSAYYNAHRPDDASDWGERPERRADCSPTEQPPPAPAPKIDKYAEFDLDMLARKSAQFKATAAQRETAAVVNAAIAKSRQESLQETWDAVDAWEAAAAAKQAKLAAKAAKKASKNR